MANGTTQSGISHSLAERIQSHLTDEEHSLVEVLEAVRELHKSLRELDGEGLTKALQTESDALRQAELMQNQRQQMRTDVANELGMAPAEFSLGVLVERTTGVLQSSIAESRERLTAMSAEMDRLNRQNAAMIQQSLSLMRGIVGRLTGTAATCDSYNAGGAREEAHVGSLVQWGG